ncbi:alpha/beta fold hydrolase [Nocardia sp. NPDC003963]
MSESSPGRTHDDTTVRGLHVVIDGNPAAPPLLLIHGSGATGSIWAPMVPSLATEYRVVTIDLPGCGRSAPAPTYAVAQQADRTAAVLDELGVRNPKVVGHSSGGYVATALVERRPDLVGELVLVSTGPSHAALLPEPAILRVLTAPPFGPLVWAIRTDAMTRRGLAAMAAAPITVPDGVVADLRRTSYRTFRAILAANGDYIAARTVPERLAEAGKPLLAIFGDADPRWDPASLHRYETVPGAELEYLRGVGHIAMLEDRDALARAILGYARHERS